MVNSGRGNQIAMRQFAINQFKKEYKRKDYSEDKLRYIKSSLENHDPRDKYHKKKEYELRIKAINELIGDE